MYHYFTIFYKQVIVYTKTRIHAITIYKLYITKFTTIFTKYLKTHYK